MFRAKPSNLEAAIRAALATENFEKMEAQRAGPKLGNWKCRMLDDAVGEEAVQDLKGQQNTQSQFHETIAEPGLLRRRDTRMYRFGKQRRPATPEDICYNCRGHGHFSWECPSKRRPQRHQGNDNQPVLRPEGGLESRQGQPTER